MTHVYRRCFKCGASQVSNPDLRMHKIPALNKKHTNVYQLMSWAIFCQPENDWFNLEALGSLSKSCKVICSKHFEEEMYTSVDKIRLHRHAVPTLHKNDENQQHQHTATNPPNIVENRKVLGVHDQILSRDFETSATSMTKIKKEMVTEELKEGVTISTPNVPKPLFKKKASIGTKQAISKSKIYNKCKYLLRKINKLKMSLKQNKSIDILEMLKNNDDVTNLIKNKISPSMALLLQGDIQNGKRKHRGRRWNEEQKFLALELFKKSPRTYRLLARLFCLPSPSTLRKLPPP